MKAASYLLGILTIGATLFVAGCGDQPAPSANSGETSIGVLLVAHGFKSSTWVHMIEDLA